MSFFFFFFGHGELGHEQNAHQNARGDVARHNTTSHACSSARNAATSAFVFLLASMATKLCALATITGRPREEDPNAPETSSTTTSMSSFYYLIGFFSSLFFFLTLISTKYIDLIFLLHVADLYFIYFFPSLPFLVIYLWPMF